MASRDPPSQAHPSQLATLSPSGRRLDVLRASPGSVESVSVMIMPFDPDLLARQ